MIQKQIEAQRLSEAGRRNKNRMKYQNNSKIDSCLLHMVCSVSRQMVAQSLFQTCRCRNAKHEVIALINDSIVQDMTG